MRYVQLSELARFSLNVNLYVVPTVEGKAEVGYHPKYKARYQPEGRASIAIPRLPLGLILGLITNPVFPKEDGLRFSTPWPSPQTNACFIYVINHGNDNTLVITP